MISSLENKKVKELTKLHQKKYRQEEFLLTSFELIEAAYKNNKLALLIHSGNLPFEFNNCLEVSKEVLFKISKQENIDYCGVAKKITFNDNYQKRVIILDHLQDPLNVGRIIEAAAVFGFDSIVLSNESADIYNEKCLVNSKGKIFEVNIYQNDLEVEINKLKQLGFKVYSTGLSNNTINMLDIEKDEKMAFVLGNEGSGVKKEIMAISDATIKIDMRNIDSLNVAMAAAIVMYNFSI